MISLTFFGQANKDKQSGRESSKKSKNEKSDHKKTLKISENRIISNRNKGPYKKIIKKSTLKRKLKVHTGSQLVDSNSCKLSLKMTLKNARSKFKL
jgi:hypothetical protein